VVEDEVSGGEKDSKKVRQEDGKAGNLEKQWFGEKPENGGSSRHVAERRGEVGTTKRKQGWAGNFKDLTFAVEGELFSAKA